MDIIDSGAQAGIGTAGSEECQEASVQQGPAEHRQGSNQQDAALQPLPGQNAALQPLPEQNAAPHLPPLMPVSEAVQPQPSEHTPAAHTHPDQQNRCANSRSWVASATDLIL